MRSLMTLFLFVTSQICLAVADTGNIKDKAIPSLTNEPVGLGNYLQMFFGLFIIIALIIGMAWFMRRMSNMTGNTAGNLKVLGGVSVGQRERVVLIQAGKTQLLVGVAPGAVRQLHVLEEPVSDTDAVSTTQSGFAEKLHAAIKNRSNQ